MPPLDQIRESIEARLAELNDEISALQTARAALHTPSAGTVAAIESTQRTRKPARRRSPRSASNGHGADSAVAPPASGADQAAPAAAPVAAVPAARQSADPPPKPRARRQRKPSPAGRRVEVLLVDKLESMLREAGDGLSAITISKRSNAAYAQVRDLLRELESAGQVRRTGTRRSSLWRLISEEEQIAARAAELEKLSRAKPASPPAQDG